MVSFALGIAVKKSLRLFRTAGTGEDVFIDSAGIGF
jgi:hypothetical protein